MPQLSEEAAAALMQKTEPGERIISHSVPSQAFRVTTSDDRTFRMQQLQRSAGDRWTTLSTHHENVATDDAWESAYPAAREAMHLAQHEFLMALRRLKVQRNQMLREQGAR